MAHRIVGGEFQGTERFRVVRRLGAGGMGVVYRAFDEARYEDVALKVLRQNDPTAILRFKSEFRSLTGIVHPNLAQLYELFSDRGRYFFTMELVDGVDYLMHVREQRHNIDTATLTVPMPELGKRRESQHDRPPMAGHSDLHRLRHATAQLVHGVRALHEAGKLHRDIKPTNVLVTEAGRVVLLDFGLVTEADASEYDSSNRLLVGTAHYMSPEQSASRPVGPPSDWYSVGAMLFQALTGRLPFEGPPLAVLTEKQNMDPPSPSMVAEGIPPALDELVTGLLSRHPARRPDAGDILRVMDDHPAPRRGFASGSRMIVPAFVGRARHLRALRNALHEADGGQFAAVYVHGKSGMGKSALLDRFARELSHGKTATVLAGRCYERESVPYKALDALFDALSTHLSRQSLDRQMELLPRGAGALSRLFPVLRRVEAVASLDEIEVMDPHELRSRATHAMREILRRMAAERAVVLEIDDLQWGDVDSVRLLVEVLRPPAPPVLLLASYRTESVSSSEAVQILRRDLRVHSEAGVRELEVGALTHQESASLALGRLAGGMESDAMAAAIAREAGGNPLFVDELVRYVQSGAAGRFDAFGPLGSITLEDAIRARIAVLAPGPRLVLELVCVAGYPMAAALAVRAADIEVSAQAVLSELVAAHLLKTKNYGGYDVVETHHNQIRETVMVDMPGARVAELHGRLAWVLEGIDHVDPETLALHFHAAGEVRRAGELALQAADQAAQTLAFDRAVRLYRVALDSLSRDEITRRGLMQQLGEVLTNAGRGAEAAEEFLEAAEIATPPEALELRRRAADQLLRAGHIDEGLDAMRSVLAAVGLPMAEGARSAMSSLLWRRARIRMRGLRFTERPAADVPVEELRRIDVCWSVATGLGTIDTILGADYQTRHLLLALEAGEPYRVARALAVESMYSAIGGPAQAKRTYAVLAQAETLANRIGHPHAIGMARLAHGMAAYQSGRYREALAGFEDADQVFRERCTGVAFEIAAARRFAIDTLFNLGEIGEMSRRMHERLREAEQRGDLYSAVDMRTGLPNSAWLAADDPASAHREAQVGMSRWSRSGFHLQHYYDALAHANAALYSGDVRRAHRGVEEMWPPLRRAMLLRIQIVRVEATFLRGRAALAYAAVSGDRTVAGEAKSAASKLDGEPIPAAEPSAALLRAGLAQLRGERDAAMGHLERASSGFAQADMAMMVAVCNRQHGLLSGDPVGEERARDAEVWMVSREVVSPARFAQLFLPAPGTSPGLS